MHAMVFQRLRLPNWYVDLFLEFAKENVVDEALPQRYKDTKQKREL